MTKKQPSPAAVGPTKIKPLPPLNELRRLFTYNHDTGLLMWNVRDDMPPYWNEGFANKPAGSRLQTKVGAREHRYVSIHGKSYLLHRVIWKVVTGLEPRGMLHYKDGDPTNIRFENLTEKSYIEMGEPKTYSRPAKLDKPYKGAFSELKWDDKAEQWRIKVYWNKDLKIDKLVGTFEWKAKKEAKALRNLVARHNSQNQHWLDNGEGGGSSALFL